MADNSSLLGGMMPTQRRTDIPTLLRGLGAAATGQVPQFRQQMQAEQTQRMQNVIGGLQLEDALAKSAAQDALKIQQLAKTGNLRDAMDILGDRAQLERQLGVDTSSTMRLAESLNSGGFEAIMPQIDSTVDMAVRIGLIEPFGGEVPSAFRSLQLQAEAAGLTPGTPDYEEFMSYRGFEGRMGAAKTINYKDGTFVTKPRVGPPEVYDKSGKLIADPIEKQRVLDAAIQSGIVYESDVAAGRARGTATEERNQEVLDTGIRAAMNIQKLKDAIEILDTVETGGFASLGIKLRRQLGITSADEGRLAYILRKNVLQQLKPTFGAAFTAREGDLLASIEANENQSTEANRALLEDVLNYSLLDIQRARVRAADMGESGQLAIQDMEGFLRGGFYPMDDLQVENGSGQPTPPPAGPQVIRFDAQGNIIPD